ncbi:hypothetical protein [Solihabitans fulvus]|uniref:hypothetical protein n=1 Tax=Solihabitans fulvus TaxID=1892852 RepID=UPI001CB75D85|nr:hypothetical protein [Solihabitans fulvus]
MDQHAAVTLRAAREFWQLPDDELDQLLALIREAGRTELKLVVPEPAHEAACATLGVDLARARLRRVYFLDTEDLALHRHGVVARVRSIDRKPDDSVIKLRPVVPADLPPALRRARGFVVEVDGMPGGYVCSGALKKRLGVADVERVVTLGHPLRSLFSKPQLALLAAYAPRHAGLDGLTVFGPVEVRRRKVTPAGVDGVLVVQQWRYPDGSRLLELSTRGAADVALRVAGQAAALLRARGIDLAGAQQTKTRATLDFFTRLRPGLAEGA